MSIKTAQNKSKHKQVNLNAQKTNNNPHRKAMAGRRSHAKIMRVKRVANNNDKHGYHYKNSELYQINGEELNSIEDARLMLYKLLKHYELRPSLDWLQATGRLHDVYYRKRLSVE